MMDIYEATTMILKEAVPDANVSAYVLTYNAELNQFDLPDFPAITYNYGLMTPVVAHDYSSDLFRVYLDVEVWGDLEQIADNAKKVMSAINAKVVEAGNVVFTLVMTESRDVTELGLDFKRRVMRFSGLVEVGEDNNDSR